MEGITGRTCAARSATVRTMGRTLTPQYLLLGLFVALVVAIGFDVFLGE